MALIGYHCSHEQYPPSQLLRHLQLATEAGFGAAMCSDHFHPWTEQQGNSGFAWSWLGAAMQASPLSFGTVCAPGQRYHPAIIAQAAATLAGMFPGRFWLAVGSGEALNESITGAPWPDKAQRNQRLRECVDVMRALWSGETVSHEGMVSVRNARLYSLPATAPLIIGACLSPETARWMGGWADGMVTVAQDPDSLRKVVDAFRSGGGEGKPMYLQVALSCAGSEEEALQAACREWPQAGLQSDELSDLDSPQDFARAAARLRPADVATGIRISSSLQQHVDWLASDMELGFERLYLHNVHRDQASFIAQFAEHVLPALAK
ncbi:TIGR03885 family FMN-dependent LLM class oxidoreductase [Noviherbaspirillum aridicola]|uniref:LLM class F420-dependent oxidoreductase n=1 Tax=Noviherbaspirillum aridicola TaxID=2849687 RepID=A0ABQ4Q8N5_9BURK|nr:TIGR03885 family FMN-dependent LLM class oxidoreductase [Noviherbaspirillum aridicola]GIZ53272.1 LLM class F420-dependent oxidoreductase [Noviherbaspirillum aridicola]